MKNNKETFNQQIYEQAQQVIATTVAWLKMHTAKEA